MLIKCNVRTEVGGNLWVVTFPDHPDLELAMQSDWDQAAFACSCGKSPNDSPSEQAFIDLDPTDIEQCPDDYLGVATPIGA